MQPCEISLLPQPASIRKQSGLQRWLPTHWVQEKCPPLAPGTRAEQDTHTPPPPPQGLASCITWNRRGSSRHRSQGQLKLNLEG